MSERKNELDFFATAYKRLDEIDERLKEIAESIKLAQPKKAGAVTLHFNPCGKNCSGCPHPTWRKWYVDPSKDNKKFLSYVIKHPFKSLSKKKDFVPVYPITAMLVREAEVLLKERSDIINYIKNAKKGIEGAMKASANKVEKVKTKEHKVHFA